MSKIPLFLSALLMLSMVVIVAPNIFALNRGRVLRNIAIWLAIFAGLGLIYQSFGPGSPHPLFNQPEAMQQYMPPATVGKTKTEDAKPDDQGFTPPKEE